MLCLHSSTLLVNMTPLLWFMALTSSSRLLRAPGFSVKMMHTSGIRCCCYTGTPTTAGQSWRNLWVDYLYPVALHLFLTVTNSSGECRPRVDTTLLQMTRAVVGDMQHSSKNLECRTQCSRGGGGTTIIKKCLTITADDNSTQITAETIVSGVFVLSTYIHLFYQTQG